MKKNQTLHIKLTQEQKSKLQSKANELGITLSDFCRMVLLLAIKGSIKIQ